MAQHAYRLPTLAIVAACLLMGTGCRTVEEYQLDPMAANRRLDLENQQRIAWAEDPNFPNATPSAKTEPSPEEEDSGLWSQLFSWRMTPSPYKERVLSPAMAQQLDAARGHFAQQEYAKAEKLYERVAKNKRAPDAALEEAVFFEAECQRLQRNYRAAEQTYKLLLENFRHSQYASAATDGLFKIADYWLEDTRKEMLASQQQADGKISFVMPASYIHFGKDKPFLDTEGHALLVLETVRMHDINGPLGEKALFYLATVKFYRRDYRDADFYFSQLYQQYPNSGFAAKAVKQSVICKQLCTGGSVYDTRTVEESKKLLHVAQASYQELSRDQDWIQQQLVSINQQQADRDFKIAEFYKRTGHPGSAYFYYELVRRCYPNTQYALEATERMTQLKAKVDSERADQARIQEQLMPRRESEVLQNLPQPQVPQLPQPPGAGLQPPSSVPAPPQLPAPRLLPPPQQLHPPAQELPAPRPLSTPSLLPPAALPQVR